VLACFLFAKYKKISFYKLSDTVILAAPLAAIFVRLGNFFNGEIVGKITALPWAIQFPNFIGFRHPTMLYMALYHLFIFIILFNTRNKNWPKGFRLWLFVSLFAAFRFLIEFTKDPLIDKFIGPLSAAQWWSIVYLAVGLIMLYKVNKKNGYKAKL